MEFEIKPYERIGILQLGLKRQSLHQILEGEILTMPLEKGQDGLPDSPLTDYFTNYDAKIEYDRHEHAVFIEVGPAISVTFEGKSLFSMSYRQLLAFFSELDPALMLEDVGFTSEKYGIAVYAPKGVRNPKKPCELISVFVKGYYDEDIY